MSSTLLTTANNAAFSSAAPKHASTRPANWPTKRAFYANHFYTGNEALELNI